MLTAHDNIDNLIALVIRVFFFFFDESHIGELVFTSKKMRSKIGCHRLTRKKGAGKPSG